MSETTEELYARALAAADDEARLPLPAIADWETFPFEGGLRVRPLLAPVEVGRPRLGETATDCWRCQRGEDGVIWGDDRWLRSPLQQPSGLPCVVLLQPRDHHDLGDLPDALTGCNARLEKTASNDNGSRLSRPRSGDRRRWKNGEQGQRQSPHPSRVTVKDGLQ